MDQQNQPLGTLDNEVEENVLLGTLGAFLFALAGGVIYVVLHLCGFISALSALVGVICAIKGYAIFAKKETKRGVVIAVIMAALVIILAWYLCFCLIMVDQYQIWLESGEVDYAPTLLEYIPFAFYDLVVNPSYFLELLWSVLFGGLACWSYVANRTKREAAIAAQQQAQARTQMLAEQQAAQEAAEAQAKAEAEAAAEDPIAKAKAFYDSVGNEETDTAASEDSEADSDSENA